MRGIRVDGGIILSAVQASSFEVVHCFDFPCMASRFNVLPKNPPIGQLHFGSVFPILRVLIFACPCRVFREVHEFPLHYFQNHSLDVVSLSYEACYGEIVLEITLISTKVVTLIISCFQSARK